MHTVNQDVFVHQDAGELGQLANELADRPIHMAVLTTDQTCVTGKVDLLAIHLPNGRRHILDLRTYRSLGPIVQALSTATVVGHDLQTALGILRHRFGVDPAAVADTMLMAKVMEGGRFLKKTGYYAFSNMVVTHLREAVARPLVAVPPDLQMGSLAPLLEELRLLPSLHREIAQRLGRPGFLFKVAELENSVLPIVIAMELRGMPIDGNRWASLLQLRRRERDQLEKQLQGCFGPIKFHNMEAVREALRKIGIFVQKTNSDHLAPYADHPMVGHLVRYRQLNSFVQGLGPAVLRGLEQFHDGRVHARFDQLGCATGRFTSSAPNLLGIPNKADSEIRSCVVVADGMALIDADFSAAELVVLAQGTGDENLRDTFRRGKDPIRINTARMLGIPEEEVTDEQRQFGKIPTYGTCYGMAPESLVLTAKKKPFNLDLSLVDASRYLESLAELYQSVEDWKYETLNEMPDETRTLGGRVRYYEFDDTYQARLASPVQGTIADALKIAMVTLAPEVARYDGHLLLPLHDELLYEVPREHAEEMAALVSGHMKNALASLVPDVPVKVKTHTSSSWLKR
jgi:DNA polymerase I-like protein with 3'-5' exonuclease and polymerase domains